MKSNIVLIRGVQGSGKSTLASLYKNQGYEHLEADMFHVVDGVYKWDPTRLGAAHLWCQDTAEKYMVEGKISWFPIPLSREKRWNPT